MLKEAIQDEIDKIIEWIDNQEGNIAVLRSPVSSCKTVLQRLSCISPDGLFSRERAATMVRNTCKVAGMDVIWAVDGINFVKNAGAVQARHHYFSALKIHTRGSRVSYTQKTL